MILGIGADIVHVPRIVALCSTRGADKLATRILSSQERLHWNNLPSNDHTRIQFLAVRWSVKEAAYKALYPVVRPTWKDLTYSNVLNAHHPKPSLNFNTTTPGEHRVGRLHVTVSHDGEYVLAYVMAEDLDSNPLSHK